MMKKLCAVIALGIMTVCGLSACGEGTIPEGGADASAAGVAAKDSVIVAMSADSEPAAGFDPAYGWGAGEHVHEPLIQSTLTVTTPELLIENDLATKIAVSEDGLIWTVDIRDDVKFTDGQPLAARDVAFTYNAVKRESTVNDFTMLKEAVALDDSTVEFHMERPYSIWPYTMAEVGIVPQHAYGEDYGQRPIGSGRYIMAQWDKGQQVIFEANPDYYGEAPNIKRLTVVFMGEDAAFAAAQAGQVDVAYTSATLAENVPAGYSLLSVQTVDNRGINLPATAENGGVGNDFTADVAVRRAINMGVDRQRLIDNVLDGHGKAAYSVCDGMPWFSENSVVEHDSAAAAALLEGAGWTAGADGMRTKNGTSAELRLIYPAGDSVRQALCEELSNQLKELGIAASVAGVDWDTAYAEAFSTPMMWGWGAHTPMEMYNIYHTAEGGTARYSPYANAAVDAYMDDALAAASLEQSYELWQKAQYDGAGGITADVPWVWLVNIDHLYWVRDGLTVAEQKIHPHGHGWSIVNNIDKWEWA